MLKGSDLSKSIFYVTIANYIMLTIKIAKQFFTRRRWRRFIQSFKWKKTNMLLYFTVSFQEEQYMDLSVTIYSFNVTVPGKVINPNRTFSYSFCIKPNTITEIFARFVI